MAWLRPHQPHVAAAVAAPRACVAVLPHWRRQRGVRHPRVVGLVQLARPRRCGLPLAAVGARRIAVAAVAARHRGHVAVGVGNQRRRAVIIGVVCAAHLVALGRHPCAAGGSFGLTV
eukprot:359394-Chlamydomonas_euryale.AAC.10